MYFDFDFRPIFILATIGGIVTILAILVGLPCVALWLLHHISFIP